MTKEEFKFQTYFGQVTGHTDTEEFISDECIIIARNSDNDGPYWEDESNDWGTLNDLCHRIFDDNLYGVASKADYGIVIDSTGSYEEMSSWSAWVTDNPNRLSAEVRKLLKEELKGQVDRLMCEELTTEEEMGLQEVLDWTNEVYDRMKDTDDDSYNAFHHVAEEKGYETV